MMLRGFPKVFRGCMWIEEQWEYDAPMALYFPVHRYTFSNNSYGLDSMVENVCFDLAEGKPVETGWPDADKKEFLWRNWSLRVNRRRRAWHVTYRVRWIKEERVWEFRIVDRSEEWRGTGK